MPLIDPEPIISFMRVQRERDLAIVAIVASMGDDERDAVERLQRIEKVMKGHKKTFDRRTKGGRQQGILVDGVLEMAPRIRDVIEKVIERQDDEGTRIVMA